MKFHQPRAELFAPSGKPFRDLLRATTHLAIGAHADDAEIFAAEGILAAATREDAAFSVVVVCDGRGSARSGDFANASDDEIWERRRQEQREAARLGGYNAAILLDFPSSTAKDVRCSEVVADLTAILRAVRPRVLYSHNPWDRHATHVAVALRTLSALRLLSPEERPERVIGCEVWGDLDWLPEAERVVMDVSHEIELQERLLRVFESQLAGGKRYDLAAMGRRRAHATFGESHHVDRCDGVILGVDLMPLVVDANLTVHDFVEEKVCAFQREAAERVERLS